MSAPTAMKLFVYGELCRPPVLRELLGRVPPARPGLLPEFARRLNRRTGYYRAHRHPGSMIAGLVMVGIEVADFDSLDRFENVAGGEYERIKVGVRTFDDAVATAWVYVAKGGAEVPPAMDSSP